MRRTDVWISRDEMVDFLEYDASSEMKKLNATNRNGQNEKLTGSFGGNALKDVVDKGVEDGHRLVGDTGVGVDLLEDCRRVRQCSTLKKEKNVPL